MRSDHTSWRVTSLLLWLCTLPIIGVLILPWLGARVALIVAAAKAQGCTRLLSLELPHEAVYDSVQVLDPRQSPPTLDTESLR